MTGHHVSIVLIPVLALATCFWRPKHLEACPDIARRYILHRTMEQELEMMANVPDLPTQYQIYLCGTQYIHPGLQYLSEPLAARGEPAARYLEGILATTTHDRTIIGIVAVFADMQRGKTYDVRGDTMLLALIDRKVTGITDATRRSHADFLLGLIRPAHSN